MTLYSSRTLSFPASRLALHGPESQLQSVHGRPHPGLHYGNSGAFRSSAGKTDNQKPFAKWRPGLAAYPVLLLPANRRKDRFGRLNYFPGDQSSLLLFHFPASLNASLSFHHHSPLQRKLLPTSNPHYILCLILIKDMIIKDTVWALSIGKI